MATDAELAINYLNQRNAAWAVIDRLAMLATGPDREVIAAQTAIITQQAIKER